jgi:hypothetical protein
MKLLVHAFATKTFGEMTVPKRDARMIAPATVSVWMVSAFVMQGFILKIAQKENALSTAVLMVSVLKVFVNAMKVLQALLAIERSV